jgi:hypothetical protein
MLQLAIAILIMLALALPCVRAPKPRCCRFPCSKPGNWPSLKTPGGGLYAIRQQINRPIATIVILNNLFNIVGSITIGSIAAKVFGDALLGVFSGI